MRTTSRTIRKNCTIPDNGNARQFIIPISDAGGTVNDITITTGENITLQNGDEFYFVAPTATNTGDVTITVDGNAAFELVKSDGLGTRIQMGVGELRQHGYDLIRFTRGFVDEFTWESAIQGNAAAYNVGILAGNLVALNSAAVIDSDRLGTGGADRRGSDVGIRHRDVGNDRRGHRRHHRDHHCGGQRPDGRGNLRHPIPEPRHRRVARASELYHPHAG